MSQSVLVSGCHAELACAVPTVERAPEEPPPFVVLVQGPPQVGFTISTASIPRRNVWLKYEYWP